MSIERRLSCRVVAFAWLLLAIAAVTGCGRDANQVPALQGGEAVDARP